MPKTEVKITFHKPQVVANIKAASDYALTIMGNQALMDANMHTPKDQKVLRRSAIISSDIRAEDGEMTLRWTTPYAQYLWHGDVMHGRPDTRTYGPEKLKFTDALAREQWAKYAQEVYGEEWKKVFEAAMRKEMEG